MTKADEAAQSGEVIDQESGMAPLSPQGLEIWEAMISTVPDAEGAGYENIVRAIATATSLDQLDAPWSPAAALRLLNIPLMIQSVAKSPSDFEQGLGWFFIVRAAIAATGELVTFTSGSGSVVLQLAKACALEQTNPGTVFPFEATLRQSKRPSSRGFYPQHLEIAR